MEDAKFQIAQLLSLAFGDSTPVFYPDGAGTKKVIPGYPDIELMPVEKHERLSWMGTPIVFPVTFKGGTYKVFNNSNDVVDYQIADFELPAATMVNFSQDKVNPNTQMPGNIGWVNEFYSFSPWDIRIRGLCLDDPSRNTCKTAKEQKQELLKWNTICSAVSVVGELFFEKDIHAISLGPVVFNTLEGKPNVFPFEIACHSDKRFELVL
jgi:hypothetical protein